MSRPNYPNCVMTPGVIRGVQERQRDYDQDPEAYENREKQHREDMQRHEEQMQEAMTKDIEREGC